VTDYILRRDISAAVCMYQRSHYRTQLLSDRTLDGASVVSESIQRSAPSVWISTPYYWGSAELLSTIKQKLKTGHSSGIACTKREHSA